MRQGDLLPKPAFSLEFHLTDSTLVEHNKIACGVVHRHVGDEELQVHEISDACDMWGAEENDVVAAAYRHHLTCNCRLKACKGLGVQW